MQMNGAKLYEEVEANTIPKVNLVIMCYEKILELLRDAAKYIEKKEYDKKTEALSKAMDIIIELINALDFKRGKQIAYGLNSIYLYCLNTIIEADRKNDSDLLQNVINVISEIKEAWDQIGGRKNK